MPKEKSEKKQVKEKQEEKTKTSEKQDFVKWFSELNKDSGEVAGGKGANLGEMYNNKISVPPGFVVTAQAYDYFIEKAGIDDEIKKLLGSLKYEDTKHLDEVTKKIREKIEKSKMPKEIEQEILEAYEHLDAPNLNSMERNSALDILKNSSEPIFVAVRSSATTEDLADASFAGQQDTYLNVKGDSDLIDKIKSCFASLFTSRATYYRHKKGFKHEQAHLAVIVQKMIDAEKSGVVFSKDPTNKTEDIIIEAVWGLGEGIVSGRITPDKYILSESLDVKNKKTAKKKIAITRDSQGKKKVEKLSDEKSSSAVLTTSELKKLGEIALKLEEHYEKPQDIEFSIEKDEVYIVQTRPVTTIKKGDSKEIKDLKGEVLLEGLAASPGVGSGKVKIVNEMSDLQKVVEGDVLVTGMTNPDMVVTMQKCSAIVTDEGGMTAHAAIVSREMGIPAIVGTDTATKDLKDGQEVTVDGYNGKVFKGILVESSKKEIKPVEAETKTEIKVIVDLPSFAERASKTGLKKVGLTRIEGIIAESGKHPEYFLKNKKVKDYEDIIFKGILEIAEYFKEVWVRTSDIRSDEYKNLEGAPKEKEANPMLGMHGIRYSLRNPELLKAELNALKKVSEKKGVKIGVLSPQIISVEEVKQLKKIVKEIGFENLKLGVMIETPAAVQIIKELCEEKIDFISFGTNDLTQYMLALDRGNEAVQELYDEMHPAILYQLGYVIRVCKKYNVETSICGQAGSKKKMAKHLVENGIDSISVNADMAKEISEYVKQVEEGKVKDTDEEPRQYEKMKQDYKKKFKKRKHGKSKYYHKNKNNLNKGGEKMEKEKKDKIQNQYYEKHKDKVDKDIKAIEKEKKEYKKKEETN